MNTPESDVRRLAVALLAGSIEKNAILLRTLTGVMNRSVRQEAVGLVLNDKLNSRRDESDRLKAILHRYILRGPAAVNEERHTDFRGHLRGRIQYIAQANGGRLERLTRLFEQIDWSV